MNTTCTCIQIYPTTEPLWQAGRRGPLGILPGAIPEVLGSPQLEASQKFVSRVTPTNHRHQLNEMADIDEDSTIRAPDTTDTDLSDEPQDFRFLSALSQ